MAKQDTEMMELEEKLVMVNKSAKVVKGGRRFSFSALVVVGDGNGRVGFGYGKAKSVPSAIAKASYRAKKDMIKVALEKDTIPFPVEGEFDATKVRLLPGAPGTGIIASGSVRAVVECTGIRDILSKVYGSSCPLNVVRATFEALKKLKTREEIERIRGVKLSG